MESGNPETDSIRNGILTIHGGVTEYVGPSLNHTLPTGATVIDAEGGVEPDSLSIYVCPDDAHRIIFYLDSSMCMHISMDIPINSQPDHGKWKLSSRMVLLRFTST